MSIVNIPSHLTLDFGLCLAVRRLCRMQESGVDLVVVSVETNFEIITHRKNCHLRLLYGDSKNWH